MLFNRGKYSTIIGRCYAPHRLVVGLLHLGLLVLPSEPLSEWLSEGLSPTPNHALISPPATHWYRAEWSEYYERLSSASISPSEALGREAYTTPYSPRLPP